VRRLALLSTTCYALAIPPRPAGAQQADAPASVVIARVSSRDTGAPLPGTRVSIEASREHRTADAAGQIVLRLPRQAGVIVRLQRLGYAPTSFAFVVADADTTRVDLTMRQVPATLDTVAVSADRATGSALLADVDRRRTSGRGTVVTRAQLDGWHAERPSDALRRVAGVRIMDSAGVRVAVSSRGPKLVQAGSRIGAVPCVMRVGLNGHVREPGFDVDRVPAADLHAIEVFAGPSTIPAELGGGRRDAFCGLVMLWTRVR
jgi:hypothetical protein